MNTNAEARSRRARISPWLHRSREKSSYARLGWRYQLVRLLLLVVGCVSAPDLGGGGGPPRSDRRPPPHETTSMECDQLGGEWIPNSQIAVGGICRLEPPPPPPVLHFCAGDAGADTALQLLPCTPDAGVDSAQDGPVTP